MKAFFTNALIYLSAPFVYLWVGWFYTVLGFKKLFKLG